MKDLERVIPPRVDATLSHSMSPSRHLATSDREPSPRGLLANVYFVIHTTARQTRIATIMQDHVLDQVDLGEPVTVNVVA